MTALHDAACFGEAVHEGGSMAGTKKRSKRPIRRPWKASRILTWVGLGCLAAAIIIILGFFAFAGGDSAPRRRVRQTPVVSEALQVTVDVVDSDYEPRDLMINTGAEVTWRFEGDLPHTVTEARDAFDSGTLESGDKFVLTFEDPGTYYYYCKLHHAMQGTLIVKP